MLNLQRIIVLLIVMTTPSLAHAIIYWDDEMESTSSPFYYAPHFTNTVHGYVIYAFDTNIKMSGTASIRVNFPLPCDIPAGVGTAGQCGGSVGRTFPDTAGPYRRIYFRMSGSTAQGAVIQTPSGLFQSAASAHTKMFKGQSAVDPSRIFGDQSVRHWWEMGEGGGKVFNISAEYTPRATSTTNHYTSITLQDNRWYCIETHEVVNTPGVANGVIQAWVDGVQVIYKTDIIWQREGSNYLWREFALMRQSGAGNFWWDRAAAGNTRIGCLGTTPPVDTTRPTPPTNLTAQ